MMNIINGGEHADNSVDFQEFMIMPVGANQFSPCHSNGCRSISSIKKSIIEKGFATSVGDEGGFAPNLGTNEEAIAVIMEAIKMLDINLMTDIVIALDVAANELLEKW